MVFKQVEIFGKVIMGMVFSGAWAAEWKRIVVYQCKELKLVRTPVATPHS